MVNGRRRQLLVGTMGLILAVAGVHDPKGATLVFGAIRGRFSRLKLVWADGLYDRVVA